MSNNPTLQTHCDLTDEVSGQGRPSLPMLKPKRYTRQINICVDVADHELYFDCRLHAGKEASDRIRQAIHCELVKIKKEWGFK